MYIYVQEATTYETLNLNGLAIQILLDYNSNASRHVNRTALGHISNSGLETKASHLAEPIYSLVRLKIEFFPL